MKQQIALQANHFELRSEKIEVLYDTTSISGQPLFNYRDDCFDQSFTEEEIRAQETEVGQLITVTLEEVADLRTVTFTLILPTVYIADQAKESEIQVPGIVTTTHTTIHGPEAGPEKTYSAELLTGSAKFVTF